MSLPTLKVALRKTKGKGAARRLRAAGRIPAVLYGGDHPPKSLDLDPSELLKTLDPELKRNTLLALQIDGEPVVTAMVREYQIDPLRDHLTHVDFVRTAEGQRVKAKVALELTGRSEGVKLGGRQRQVFREVPVVAPAGSIPPKLQLDTTTWQVGKIAAASEIPTPDGVTLLLNPKQTVASVSASRAIEEEAATEEGAAESAAPATTPAS